MHHSNGCCPWLPFQQNNHASDQYGKNYAPNLYLVIFCFGKMMTNFIHILYIYLTCTAAILWLSKWLWNEPERYGQLCHINALEGSVHNLVLEIQTFSNTFTVLFMTRRRLFDDEMTLHISYIKVHTIQTQMYALWYVVHFITCCSNKISCTWC